MTRRIEQRREAHQPIEVILMDGTSCHLRPKILDLLLDKERVLKFRRSTGWVTVGVDPVRSKRRHDFCSLYSGPERRNTKH